MTGDDLEITISGTAARKIGRLSAVFPDSEIRITEHTGVDADSESFYYLVVEFLDKYSLRATRSVIVHDDGWSNPSVSRLKAEQVSR